MTTGVFGGTFDPPHIGHLRAAIEAREVLALDRVLLVVANVPWQKAGTRAITPAAVRMEMVRAAVEGIPGLEACDLEIRRGGDSFTVDTLGDLRRADPDDDLVVLIGADVVATLTTWHDATRLPDLASLGVFGRPGASGDSVEGPTAPQDRAAVGAGVTWPIRRVPIPQLDISSSDVRARVQAGRSIDVLVPASVAVIIESHGIYRGRS